ncbi:MAG: hypothetical protein JNL98_43540 [Bryobacterales bacterium]|nr:hypothetical protein [Bryobacterales bacterium]
MLEHVHEVAHGAGDDVGAALALGATLLAAGCATAPTALLRADNAAAGCAGLATAIAASQIDLPSGGATIDAATLVAASDLKVAERGPTAAATITPAISR